MFNWENASVCGDQVDVVHLSYLKTYRQVGRGLESLMSLLCFSSPDKDR